MCCIAMQVVAIVHSLLVVHAIVRNTSTKGLCYALCCSNMKLRWNTIAHIVILIARNVLLMDAILRYTFLK